MPETLDHAKGRALSLLAANKPVEAICVMCHCLNGIGVPFTEIGDRLQNLAPIRDLGDVAAVGSGAGGVSGEKEPAALQNPGSGVPPITGIDGSVSLRSGEYGVVSLIGRRVKNLEAILGGAPK